MHKGPPRWCGTALPLPVGNGAPVRSGSLRCWQPDGSREPRPTWGNETFDHLLSIN